MTWMERLRLSLAPRVNADQLVERVRHGRRTVWLLSALITLWLLADIFYRVNGAGAGSHEFTLDLVSIGLLAVIGIAVLLLLHRQQIIAAGYSLAISLFVLTAISLFRYPEALFLISAAFPLAILLVGVIVGGASGYSFAIASSIALGAAWVYSRQGPSEEAYLRDPFLGIGFVLGQVILFFGTAATLHALSRQAEEVRATLQSHTERMTQLAHTDPLTGLANRRQLIDQLEREFLRARRYRRPLGLLYLDLDGFKAINDRFGHMFGDEILRSVANTMRAVLRSTDLLARIGGDEFAVLLPETPLTGAENVASKLHRALASYSQRLGPAAAPLTFCVGVSQLRDGDQSIDDVLTRADHALLLAKSVNPGMTRSESQLTA